MNSLKYLLIDINITKECSYSNIPYREVQLILTTFVIENNSQFI